MRGWLIEKNNGREQRLANCHWFKLTFASRLRAYGVRTLAFAAFISVMLTSGALKSGDVFAMDASEALIISRSLAFESVLKANALPLGLEDPEVADDLEGGLDSQALDRLVSPIKENGEFDYQVTRIDSETLEGDIRGDEQLQRVVISLTETIKNVSEQLEVKEQRIATLENQVLQLEKHIQVSAVQTNSIWPWVLVSVLVFSLLILIVYKRFWLNGGNGLNEVGVDDQVVHDGHDTGIESVRESISKENFVEQSGKSTGGATRLDLSDQKTVETDELLEYGTLDLSEDVDDLSFNEHFERLLGERDFEFARELLDFARYTEINDERYHCERLHLFEKMNDEDGFYEYYYQIESKIPTFPRNLQTQISRFVVQLAQR